MSVDGKPIATKTYKIPSSVNRSYADHEVNLSTKSLTIQPISIALLGFWVGSLFLLAFLIVNTPLSGAGPSLLLLIIWWLVATFILGKRNKTKEMAFRSIPPVIEYMIPANRSIVTRSNNDPSGFFSVAPFRSVDSDGMIKFADGTVGQAYLVVGSASMLVFDDDKRDILNRVDQFWRKADPSAEYVWFTKKEPQRVYRQVAAVSRLARNDRTGDPDVRALLTERYNNLNIWVGNKFSSIHQYLVVKADNVESLQKANSLLLGEIENSSLMIRQMTRLDFGDTRDFLGSLYKATDSVG